MNEPIARAMWRLYEPIHDVTYFAPEAQEAGAALGLKGFWMTYFAFRSAPLGECAPAVVTATFYGFDRSRVERALPEVWRRTTPDEALAGRRSSAAAALRRIADAAGLPDQSYEPVADLLWVASRQVETAGRPLTAANLEVPRPEDPLERLWQAATVLREHRGDGHVAALVAHRLSPIESSLLKVMAGETDESMLRASRAWPEQDWDDAVRRLEERGLVEHRQLTVAGTAFKAEVESLTDDLAGTPWAALGEADAATLIDALGPLADAVRASDEVPDRNPVGLGARDES